MTLGLRRLLTFFLVLWFTLFLGGFAAMGKHADAAGPRGGAAARGRTRASASTCPCNLYAPNAGNGLDRRDDLRDTQRERYPHVKGHLDPLLLVLEPVVVVEVV